MNVERENRTTSCPLTISSCFYGLSNWATKQTMKGPNTKKLSCVLCFPPQPTAISDIAATTDHATDVSLVDSATKVVFYVCPSSANSHS